MKKYVSTMIAGVAALAFASAASAQTNVIHITGSTAFRSATHNAIKLLLGSNGTYTYGWVGSSALNSASFAEFRGTATGSDNNNYPVDIKVSWSGSVAGLQTVTSASTISTWLNSSSLSTTGTPNVAATYDAPVTAEITMADSFQSSSLYTSPTLIDTVVAVVTFEFVRNNGSSSAISNITTRQASVLLNSGGTFPLSMLTGNPGDTSIVYPVGRDEGSGTRVDNFSEIGIGWGAAPIQYQPAVNGTFGANGATNGLITAVQQWPAATLFGISYPVGHSGYSSGGTLAGILGTPGNGFTLIGYVGNSDGNTAVGEGAVALSFNGVPYSNAAVENGPYSNWAYEHLMYIPSIVGSTQEKVALGLISVLKAETTTQLNPAGVALGDMQVGRPLEGGDITSGAAY